MLRAAILLLTAVPLCTAQIYDLATTSDGRDLYFASTYITIPPDWPAGVFQVACYSGTARTDGFLEVGASK